MANSMVDAHTNSTAAAARSVQPRHVAIIMDGNGRWAAARGLPRFEGHRRGLEAVRRIVRAAGDLGIEVLTLFSFSTENWNRPAQEVSDLMGLLKRFIRNDLADLHQRGVRVRIIGRKDNLAQDILHLLQEAEDLTRANQAMTLVIAFNYGARQELASAMQKLALKIAQGHMQPGDINPDQIADHLDTADLPDPDVIIRTSGEQRLSNFLLWQAAYSEFVFVPSHWPDFDRDTLESALQQFAARDRRFGGLVGSLQPAAKTGS
jgi:undecaprenyl diphosphate synthase